jgi:hypothetical protein
VLFCRHVKQLSSFFPSGVLSKAVSVQTISFHWSSKKVGSDCEMLESVQTLVHGEFGETLRACVNDGATMNSERAPRRIDI